MSGQGTLGHPPRQLIRRLRGASRLAGEGSFAMPLVIPVLLLLVLGAVTLTSRSTNSFFTATKQSDSQAARQAAESGMNRVLSALNPYSKGATEPYLSFLLGSTWVDGSGWRLTTLSPAVVQGILRSCRLSERGVLPTQQPPNPQDYATILQGDVGVTRNNTVMRYEVVDYEAPAGVKPETWPTECNDFTTVTGGSAQISVRGTVVRNGRTMASYTLTRTLDIQGVAMPDVPAGFLTPGPPIGLRIAGKGTGLSNVESYLYDPQKMWDPAYSNSAPLEKLVSVYGDPSNLRPQCNPTGASCDLPDTNKTTVIPNGDSDLPNFPEVPPGLTAKNLTLSGDPSNPDHEIWINENSINDPRLSCKRTSDDTEVSCVIGDIDVDVSGSLNPNVPHTPAVGIIKVDTSGKPINLFIQGNVGGPQPKAPDKNDNDNPISNLKDGRVIIVNVNCVDECKTAAPIYFNHYEIDTTTNRPKYRSDWNKLRIFGNPNNPQTFYIAISDLTNSDLTSLHGAFVWLPKGKLVYGNPTYTYDSTKKVWDPDGEKLPGELYTSWWVNDLNLESVKSSTINFILPLYGNPEAMDFLTGSRGYFKTGNTFTPDPRFPVYPTLLRIRSTL